MEVLLVEDNRRISEFMVQGLEESGFSVELAETGKQARRLITDRPWDLIILDIMLPEIDGIELLQYTRYKKVNTPILVVSALGEPDDKVKALDYGADDYLSKPFHFKELVARIHALTRRYKSNNQIQDNVLICDDLSLDIDQHLVSRNGEDIKLTIQEFKLLKLLMENKNKVLSRHQILHSVWGIDFNANNNVVDVYISYLRNKVDQHAAHKLIQTVKGRGYLIRTREEN